MKRLFSAVLIVAAVSTLAACGDDDEETSTATTAVLTKTQYTQQANTICKRVTDELAQIFESEGFPVVRSQVAAFIPKVAGPTTKGMTELNALQPPKDEEAKLQKFRDEAKAIGDRFAKASTDAAEAEKLFDDEGGWQPLRDAAEEYGGLEDCVHIDEEGEGDEEEPKPDPATFSAEKRAYIEKVDAICKKYDAEESAIEDEVFGEGFPPSIEKWATGLPKFADTARRRSAEIDKVTPPAADKATIDEIEAQNTEIIAEVDKAAAAAKAGNEQALTEVLGPLFPQFDESDAKLRAYGFQVCGAEDEDEEE